MKEVLQKKRQMLRCKLGQVAKAFMPEGHHYMLDFHSPGNDNDAEN